MSFARVRDIVQGRRAPVRLSEFLAICDVCHADPVQTLRQIIAEAARIQAEQTARERNPAPRIADIPPTDTAPALADTAGADAGDAAREARRRELDETAARESRLEEETLRQLEADPLSLAAYHDPHKHDPQPDNAA